MNSLLSFCLPILVKYLRLIAPSAKSLMSVFVGSQDVQLEFFLDICCLAKILSLTVSAFKELVNLVLTQFTCKKIRSTHAEECGKIVNVVINLDSRLYFGLSNPSLIFLN